MIGTAAAILGAAVIGGGASALAASKGAKAAEKEGQLAYQASQDTIASNERLAAQTRADNEPFRQAGVSALSAVGGAFGLPGYGPPSMTAPQYASTPVPTVGGVSMTGKPAGGMTANYGTPDGGATMIGHNGGPPMSAPAPKQGDPDWGGFLAANPDVVTYYNRTPEAQTVPIEDFARQVYDAQKDVRAPPPTVGYVAAPGYTDPTAPQGYSSPERPAGYTAPVRMTGPALDVSAAAYQKSPGYDWQLEQGQNALDHVASAGGGIMSGARQKAALRYSQGVADQDYTDWRNYTTQQFNTDRARGDAIYSEDNNFNYGVNRDGQSDFQTDRGYTTGRYDTRNAQLMSLAGFGTNANNANTSAATSFAQNSNAARMTGAAAQGAAGVNASNAWTGAANNLVTTGAYLGGQYLSGNMGGMSGMGGIPKPSFMPTNGQSLNFTPW